ncbi:MAG: NADH:flavin oxidoreductase [Desulfobacterales bacterium]|nr:NADH:flavin oxidoreductase [Desulfobacterales bacterium]
MSKKSDRTTRREFLKKGAGAAGLVVFSGLGAGCVSATGESTAAEEIRYSAPGGRNNYTVFSQGKIGDLTISNRFVRSATMIGAASGGRPSKKTLEVFTKLAQGGTGMLITGFVIPTKANARYAAQMNIYDDSQINGLRELTEAVHGANGQCRLAAQIGHSGDFVGPSGIRWPLPNKRKGKALSTEEVDAIVSDFAAAVWRAQEAGFDGVELHGAHAYLLSSFLSPVTNKRTDKYGGSLEKRVHIVRAIMDQARKRVGPGFPIVIKLNSDDNVAGGIRPETFPELANEIVKTGVDAIDVSGNDCLQKGIDRVEEETYFYTGAKALEVKVPIIVTGGNRSVEHLEKLVETKEVDFFGLARPLLREPDLPNRWLEGRGDDSSTCISCNKCFGVIMQGKTAYCVEEKRRLKKLRRKAT